MQVTQYLFQSPYSNQVQIGRPDPSSVSSQTKENSANNPVESASSTSKEVKEKSMVYSNPNNIIDLYA